MPPGVALAANFERHIEKHRLHLAARRLADTEIHAAFFRRKVSGVDVGDRPAQGEPVA